MDFAVSHLPPRRLRYQKRGTSSYKDFWLIVAFQGAKMRQKSAPAKEPAEKVVKEIRRATRRQFSAEEKIRIVLEGLRGEHSIAELCRREGIVQNLYYRWSKDFLEAGKKRLAGDTARAATSDEVKDLRREASALKEVVAELTLENRLLKKSVTGDGRSNRGKRLRREDAA
jgi:transposase